MSLHRMGRCLEMLSKIQKIPAGMMLVPMFLAACINTFASGVFELGNPFTALFSSKGTMCIVAVLLVFSGISTEMGSMVKCMKKSGLLLLLKLVFNILAGILFLWIFGGKGAGGVSATAFVSCLCSCNAALYLALMQEFGDDGDIAGFAIINVTGLPFIPVCILGFANGAGIDFAAVFATLVPFVIGLLIRALDREAASDARNGMKVMIPFLGFCLGSSVDFLNAAENIIPGFLLFAAVFVCNNVPLFLIEKFVMKSPGYLSMAVSSVAGLALTVPQLMQESSGGSPAGTGNELSQIAFVMILSTVFTPLAVRFFAGKKE